MTDTTGAGDAFHGAFALMVAEGRPDVGVLRAWPAAVAALKCTRLGSRAGLPTRAELDNLSLLPAIRLTATSPPNRHHPATFRMVTAY